MLFDEFMADFPGDLNGFIDPLLGNGGLGTHVHAGGCQLTIGRRGNHAELSELSAGARTPFHSQPDI